MLGERGVALWPSLHDCACAGLGGSGRQCSCSQWNHIDRAAAHRWAAREEAICLLWLPPSTQECTVVAEMCFRLNAAETLLWSHKTCASV